NESGSLRRSPVHLISVRSKRGAPTLGATSAFAPTHGICANLDTACKSVCAPLPQKILHDRDALCRRLLVWIVPQAGHRHDAYIRQRLFQLLLCRRRYDVARATENVNRARLNIANIRPQLRRHEALRQIRVAFPNDTAIGATLRSEMRIIP